MESQQHLKLLNEQIRDFCEQRNWQQFHTAKNLTMALSVEAAELMEHFQWLTPEQSDELNGDKHEEVAMEMADVMIYLIRLSQVLKIDLLNAVSKKIQLNGEKYPVDKAYGNAVKSNKLK